MAEPAALVAEPAAATAPAVAVPEALRGGRLLPSTRFWRGFKITEVKRLVEIIGWEATCYVKEHRCSGLCRRTLSFSAHGGKTATEVQLKAWCMLGFSDAVQTREEHRDVSLKEPEGGWPSLEMLDKQDLPLDRLSLPSKRRRAA